MLVLSRKVGEQIVIPDCDLTLTVLEVRRGHVRLGILAPAGVHIRRSELPQRFKAGGVPGDPCNQEVEV